MLKKFFNNKKEEAKDTNYLSLLVAALLIHAAKIDNNYTEIEKEIIKKALIELKLIQNNNYKDLLSKAEIKEQDSNQIIGFTKEIKKKPMEFRLKIVEILLKIIYSDGVNDDFESNLIRRICGLLYVSDKDSGNLKLKIKK
jgi:uncharacterized tellurite resistance protein B-like protein